MSAEQLRTSPRPDYLGRALDLEACFDKVESQTVLRAMEAAAQMLRAEETRADSGEAVAWLVESEKAGPVSAELHEISADKVIADVVREYGDAYGATTKRPLFTNQSETSDNVLDAERWRYIVRENNKGIHSRFRIVWFDDNETICTMDGVTVDGKDDEAIVRYVDAAIASREGE